MPQLHSSGHWECRPLWSKNILIPAKLGRHLQWATGEAKSFIDLPAAMFVGCDTKRKCSCSDGNYGEHQLPFWFLHVILFSSWGDTAPFCHLLPHLTLSRSGLKCVIEVWIHDTVQWKVVNSALPYNCIRFYRYVYLHIVTCTSVLVKCKGDTINPPYMIFLVDICRMPHLAQSKHHAVKHLTRHSTVQWCLSLPTLIVSISLLEPSRMNEW